MEVRELAERADSVADDIAEKIDGIQERTQKGAQTMEDGQREVSVAIELAKKARNAFEQIIDGAETVPA